MTDRELMQEALDIILAAIKSGDWKVDGACDPDFVINALRARLSQPESGLELNKVLIGAIWDSSEIVAPPQREWVGLTPKERDELVLRAGALLDHIYEYGTISEGIAPRLKSLFTAVEAKLKEKNT